MNTVVAEFEKVSRETYEKFIENSGYDKSKFVDYDDIKIPARATKGSAGYDFYAGMEYDYTLDRETRKGIDRRAKLEALDLQFLVPEVNHPCIHFTHFCHIVVPTFIKCNMNYTEVYNDSNWVLVIAPKSGIASKTGLRLSNTMGIIDSDYYNNPDNEGHILLDICYEPYIYADALTIRPVIHIDKNQKLVQGVFLPFGTAANDRENKNFVERTGGFGSTGLN